MIATPEVVGRRRRTVAAAGAVLFLCSAVTASEWFVPGVNLAYGNEGMHIAIAAIRATVCLVVGGLAWARFARSRKLLDLTVAIAFAGVMFVESAFLLALPALLHFDQITAFSVWSSSVTSVLAPALLLAGALVRPRVIGLRTAAALIAAVVAILATAAALAFAYQERLRLAIDPGLSPAPQPQPFVGHPAVIATQAAAAAIMLAAAGRLLRSSRIREEPFLGWLAPALVIDSVASANYALFPSLYSYWVYTGDILRLFFSAVLAGGLFIELRASVRRTIELAVLEERRRLARDLHDGVAQELAFIASEVVDVPAGLHPSLPWIRSAVERALFESRRAIAALTNPQEGPLEAVVAAAAEDVTGRAGAALRVVVDTAVQISPDEREAILRVVREAVTNATRHGHASTILVTIEGRGTRLTRLVIRDDGTGIVDGRPSGGFGLTSMRERIEAIGGAFFVESSPRTGTTVQALWGSARSVGLHANASERIPDEGGHLVDQPDPPRGSLSGVWMENEPHDIAVPVVRLDESPADQRHAAVRLPRLIRAKLRGPTGRGGDGDDLACHWVGRVAASSPYRPGQASVPRPPRSSAPARRRRLTRAPGHARFGSAKSLWALGFTGTWHFWGRFS